MGVVLHVEDEAVRVARSRNQSEGVARCWRGKRIFAQWRSSSCVVVHPLGHGRRARPRIGERTERLTCCQHQTHNAGKPQGAQERACDGERVSWRARVRACMHAERLSRCARAVVRRAGEPLCAEQVSRSARARRFRKRHYFSKGAATTADLHRSLLLCGVVGRIIRWFQLRFLLQRRPRPFPTPESRPLSCSFAAAIAPSLVVLPRLCAPP
eukprot:4806517-Lingulodinium_polyedra.AAC.1